MNEHGIRLNKEQLKRIARCEITFKDVLEGIPFEEARVYFDEPYPYTLDDLAAAIKALKEKEMSVYAFGDEWFYPLTVFSDAFMLGDAMRLKTDEYNEYLPLRCSEAQYFAGFWSELENAWETSDLDLKLNDVTDLSRMIEEYECFISNRGRPVTDWEFPVDDKEYYIRLFEDDSFSKQASVNALNLCRRLIKELIAEDNVTALRVKGYACYGGSALYPCDWKVSRDCMEKLYALTDDPVYANTLGYIYYYGRCTDGVPEYDKALRYFGIGAANGYYESIYKLADLFAHGYGTKQSSRTARALYTMVYDECRRRFLNGEDTSFADAALRMGNVFARGIDAEVNAETALIYYLEANYAAKLRAQNSDFFGDHNVLRNTENTLEEVKKLLPADYFREYVEYRYPYFFSLLTDENNRCELNVARQESGWFAVTAKRIPTQREPHVKPILVCVNPVLFCERTIALTVLADPDTQFYFRDYKENVRFDYCEYNSAKNRYEFYYDGNLTAWIKADLWRFYHPENMEHSARQYRIASVTFSPGGHAYDYICDLQDVKPGDRLIVNTPDGDSEVTLVSIAMRDESELPLPIEKYKKILRKA